MTRTPATALALLLLASPLVALAQQPSTAAPRQPAPEAPARLAPSDAPVDSTQAPSGEPSLDFELLEEAPAADVAQAVDPALERRIHQRRSMLRLHQGLGFAMAAGITTSVVLGQLQFNDSFRGGGDERTLLPWHRGVVIGTTALFATVGALGVLAPTPYEKQSQWDTVRIHKLFMFAATAGMLAQAVLGILATDSYGQLSEVNLATAHQVVGYATLGAVAGGMTVLLF